jgi:hypothetical protein
MISKPQKVVSGSYRGGNDRVCEGLEWLIGCRFQIGTTDLNSARSVPVEVAPVSQKHLLLLCSYLFQVP